jgi:demethylmenaquinone methyltransferase/2-methoxy-6-polyprenyl-1,4-benzoquinol methylase
MPESNSVKRMFAGIANKYDRANHILSGFVDFYWRKVLLKHAKLLNPKIVADLATGSGDVAICLKKGLHEQTIVNGYDFCEPMLIEARDKAKASSATANILFRFGDCLNLPIDDNSVDLITISFGFRNLEDRKLGLQEFKRILKPGGQLMILEFTQPYPWFAPIYYKYLQNVLPKIAKIVTGNSDAYDYLAESIQEFPNKNELKIEIEEQGFLEVDFHPLTLSIVALHKATKPNL